MYICGESHVFVFEGYPGADMVHAGVKWGYLRNHSGIPQLSYCCCGEADSSNLNVFGVSALCRASSRKEVERVVLDFLYDNDIYTTVIAREYHNISLTDLNMIYNLSFYGKPGESKLGVHLSGAYDCFGSPCLDITDRDSLLKYAKKLCSLADKHLSGLGVPEFVRYLNMCD